jgi:glycosyltransferase involved in cell wall biosynthesis
MALDRPIVASSLEQIGDVLEDGRTARMVTPGDVAELADGIREVLALPDRGAALGAAARRGEAILAGLQAGAPAADEHSVKV